MRLQQFLYTAALTFTAFFSWLLLHVWIKNDYFSIWAGALLLTLLHGSPVFYVHSRALKERHVRFLYWGLGIHVARVVVLLFLFLGLRVAGFGNLVPFMAATMVGYFCFWVCEITGLQLGKSSENLNRE